MVCLVFESFLNPGISHFFYVPLILYLFIQFGGVEGFYTFNHIIIAAHNKIDHRIF